jgi:hypothetical protein
MDSVFELTKVVLIEQDKVLFSWTTNSHVIGLFSLVDKAREAMLIDVQKEEARKSFAYFINERRIDGNDYYSLLSCYSYDSVGNHNDVCLLDQSGMGNFHGRTKEEIRFAEGDIVEAYNGFNVMLCIVDQLPPSPERCREIAIRLSHTKSGISGNPFNVLDYSDDCYLLYALGEGDTHQHIACTNVFLPSPAVSAMAKDRLKDKREEMHQLWK